MSYNYDIQDMELTSIAPLDGSEYGKVLQLPEAGGSESAHIVIEIPASEKGGNVATVQHCDTPDGEFADTELSITDNVGAGDEKRWRIPLNLKRYIRMKVQSAEGSTARLTVRV